MKPLASADFNERLVPRSSFAKASEDRSTKASQAPDRGAEAHDASAEFLHFTETCGDAPHATGEDRAACPTPACGAVRLSDHAMILLRAVASYQACSNEDAVVLALADFVRKIGAGPLARAILDERERLAVSVEDVPDDLHDLPDFERRDMSRFSRAREALRHIKGMRR